MTPPPSTTSPSAASAQRVIVADRSHGTLPISLPLAAVYAERAISRAGLAALLRAEMIDVVLPEEEGRELVGARPDVIVLAGFAPPPWRWSTARSARARSRSSASTAPSAASARRSD